MTTATATAKFEIGKTYSCRSSCDWDCVFSYTVVARTAKRVTLEAHGERTVRGIYMVDGVEACRPEGSYSMCPSIRANRELC